LTGGLGRLVDRLQPTWRRIVARWVDVVAIGWLAVVILEVIDGTAGGVLALMVLIGFEIGCHLRWGRTPGKALLGLAVRTPTGSVLPRWAVVLRPLVLFASFAVPWAYWIPVWGTVLVVWMALSPSGRVLHDLAVGSVVVRR
jgi:uncharacterized RDD family membrane protein YckC